MKIDTNAFLDSLPIMGVGLLGIFIVTIVIIIGIYVLKAVTSKSGNSNDADDSVKKEETKTDKTEAEKGVKKESAMDLMKEREKKDFLVEEESNVSSRERILTSILYSEQLNVSELMEQANYLGIDLSGKFRTAVFGWKDEQVRRIDQADEGSSIERRNQIKKWILNEFRSYGLQHMMLHSRIDTIIIMFPEAMFSHDLLVSILQHIIQRMEDYYKLNAKVGIGSGYEYINEFKLSYQEAKNTLKISSMISDAQKIFFYEDLGIYSLLAQITNGKFLDDFVENKLGRLLQAEEMQEGDLCETLEAYLLHDCNANATAEILFIHRNTMRYRLDKIRHILNVDLSELSECLELKLAFAILKYRKNRDEYQN